MSADVERWGVRSVATGQWCCIDVNKSYGTRKRCEEVYAFVAWLCPHVAYEVQPYHEPREPS